MSDEQKKHSCPLFDWKLVNYATAAVCGGFAVGALACPEKVMELMGAADYQGTEAEKLMTRVIGICMLHATAQYALASTLKEDEEQVAFAKAGTLHCALGIAHMAHATVCLKGDLSPLTIGTMATLGGLGSLFAARAFICPTKCCPVVAESDDAPVDTPVSE